MQTIVRLLADLLFSVAGCILVLSATPLLPTRPKSTGVYHGQPVLGDVRVFRWRPGRWRGRQSRRRTAADC